MPPAPCGGLRARSLILAMLLSFFGMPACIRAYTFVSTSQLTSRRCGGHSDSQSDGSHGDATCIWPISVTHHDHIQTANGTKQDGRHNPPNRSPHTKDPEDVALPKFRCLEFERVVGTQCLGEGRR